MRRVLAAALILGLATTASAFDSLDLSYQPTGGPCDGQLHDVEWTNHTGAPINIDKVIVSGLGSPVSIGVWYSWVYVERADGAYKVIAFATEQSSKGSGATTVDYPAGAVMVQPGEHLVHRTACQFTTYYYAWVYVLVR